MDHLRAETTNTKLAAALTAVGIPLRKDVPCRIVTGDRGDRVTFFFEQKSPCGLYQTRELMGAWQNEEWLRKNPEHPFAYIMAAFENRERLTDYVRSGTPIAAVEKGSRIAFLSLNASPDLQRKVFAELKKPR